MWRIFFTTFGMVFLAELGDKTQLATMLMATQNESIWPVFFGSAAALVLSAFIGVLAGSFLVRYIPAHYLQTAAGVAFLLIGALLLFGKM